MLTEEEKTGNGARPYIVVSSGRIIDPLDPNPDDIDINDIAHSLSQQCRFTGHTKGFYSVAQHSVLVSEICNWDDALWGLLHDASEAYIADLARPIKYHAELGEPYRVVEKRMMDAIAEAFSLPAEMPASVKWADDVLLRTEIRDLMPFTPPVGDTLPEVIEPWYPRWAKAKFLARLDEVLG